MPFSPGIWNAEDAEDAKERKCDRAKTEAKPFTADGIARI
jgi:hypothetical protein